MAALTMVLTPECAKQHRRSGAAALLVVAGAVLAASSLLSVAWDVSIDAFMAPPLPKTNAMRLRGQGLTGAATSAVSDFDVVEGRLISGALLAAAAVVMFGATSAAAASSMRRQRMPRHREPVATRLYAEGPEKTKLADIKVGDKFDGTVARIANIGIWLDIGAEKQALWPKLQLPEGAAEKYKEGDKVEGLRVFEVSDGDTPSERKIRVSLKKLTAEIKAGDKLDGKVRRVMKFGVFFDIGTPTDALAPERFLGKSLTDYEPGEVVPLTIVSVDGGKVTVNAGGTGKPGVRPPSAGGASVSKFKVGDKVKAKVAKVESFGLFVNIGADRDALVRGSQLPKELSEYKQGDEVPDLRVLSVNVEKGQIEVTPRTLPSELKEGDKIEGTVKDVSEFGVFFDGGLAVDVLAPVRLLSKPIDDYSKGEVADLVVTRIDGGKVSVSTKSSEEIGTPLGKLMRGAEVTGKVLRAEAGIGVFMDIGAAEDALIREKSLPKATADYAPGDEVEGLIIVKIDAGAGQIECVLKDGPIPEQGTPLSELKPGDAVSGVVSRGTNFGVFVDIGAERDALWPNDQLPKPATDYQPGEEVTGLSIVQVDVSQSRLTVSTKRGAFTYEVGEAVTGVVKKIMPYGVFVDIGASTQALAPSRLLENDPGSYSVGSEITDLKISSIDAAQNKISVGQLDRPKASADAGSVDQISIGDLKVGSQVKGIIRMIKDYGVFVDIGLGRRDALMPTSLLGSKSSDEFKPNDEVEVYIAQVDTGAERVTLSMEEPPEGGVGSVGRSAVSRGGSNYIPQGDCQPDPDYWLALCGDDELLLWDEPLPWKEWETKYPGLVKFPKKETEIYLCTDGLGFSGMNEAQPAGVAYIPIPVHLRKPDADPPEIPAVDFDDYEIGYEYGGIKPEIHVKYRTPPFNDPNWVHDNRMVTKKA